MKIQEIINSNCVIKLSVNPFDVKDCDKAYYSKIDNSYLTFVGMENQVDFLEKYQITEQLQSVPNGSTVCIGFSPKGNAWYGWSHRAIFGFTVGHKVTYEQCGYKGEEWTAKTLEDAKQMAIDFAEGVS